jgi:hypothetical protein
MATFTTSGSIQYERYGLQLTGTTHSVPDDLLNLVVEELEAGGETITLDVCTAQFLIPSSAAGVDTIPLFKAPVQMVLTNAYLVPAANVVGGSDANTYSIRYYDTGGTVHGTPFSDTSGTAGTMLAMQAHSLGSVSSGTVTAGYFVDFYRGTAAGGTAVPDMLLYINYTL